MTASRICLLAILIGSAACGACGGGKVGHPSASPAVLAAVRACIPGWDSTFMAALSGGDPTARYLLDGALAGQTIWVTADQGMCTVWMGGANPTSYTVQGSDFSSGDAHLANAKNRIKVRLTSQGQLELGAHP